MKTASLRLLLTRQNMTSEDILEKFWKTEGNIYSLLPRDCFKEVTWAELPTTAYAVLSYQWRQNWHSMVHFILMSEKRVIQDYMWIDCKCLDQLAKDKMTTINRSDEIYRNANAYHLIEVGSLFRGWVLFELASANQKPIIHISTQDPAMIEMVKEQLAKTGFEGSKFKEESDRNFVRTKVVQRYGSVAIFNREIIAIVNRIFV